MDMVEAQDVQFSRLGLSFKGLFGRPLHAIDCQGLFCELDKYSRVAFPELKSARSRIKQSFRPTGPLPPLVFPRHWKLAPSRPAKPLIDLNGLEDRDTQLPFEFSSPRAVC
jgi:hypothetical protein